jgi:hypothetical protein
MAFLTAWYDLPFSTSYANMLDEIDAVDSVLDEVEDLAFLFCGDREHTHHRR